MIYIWIYVMVSSKLKKNIFLCICFDIFDKTQKQLQIYFLSYTFRICSVIRIHNVFNSQTNDLVKYDKFTLGFIVTPIWYGILTNWSLVYWQIFIIGFVNSLFTFNVESWKINWFWYYNENVKIIKRIKNN